MPTTSITIPCSTIVYPDVHYYPVAPYPWYDPWYCDPWYWPRPWWPRPRIVPVPVPVPVPVAPPAPVIKPVITLPEIPPGKKVEISIEIKTTNLALNKKRSKRW